MFGMSTGHGTRAILAAFFANLGIAIAKFVGFVFTRSASMLAESIHSVADTGNQALLLLGGRLARREADDRFQFGRARERYFWSFVVALVLFSLGALFSLFEAYEKLRHPEEISSPAWAFGILGIAIVLESFSFRTAIVESRPLKGDRSWWQFVRTSRSPELPVVLLEDLGALVGLMLAFGAITIAVVADAPVWDGIGTLLIGILLGVIAVILAIEMKSLLIGESARPEELRKIREAIDGSPHVTEIIHLRTQHLGPDELLVGAKVLFDDGLDTDGVAAAINDLEVRVRAVVPHARPMYVEPAVDAQHYVPDETRSHDMR
jgi:cation diffusion facilitator family transporter